MFPGEAHRWWVGLELVPSYCSDSLLFQKSPIAWKMSHWMENPFLWLIPKTNAHCSEGPKNTHCGVYYYYYLLLSTNPNYDLFLDLTTNNKPNNCDSFTTLSTCLLFLLWWQRTPYRHLIFPIYPKLQGGCIFRKTGLQRNGLLFSGLQAVKVHWEIYRTVGLSE